MQINRSYLFAALGLVLLGSLPLQANYTFLGDVVQADPRPSGVSLLCRDSVRLDLQFLRPEVVRFTLQRPEQREPLLDYPLAPTEWEDVSITRDEGDHLLLRSTVLEVIVRQTPCRIIIRNLAGDTLCADDPGMGTGWEGLEVRTWKNIAPDEKFFGLGLKTGNVNKRGQEWVMWNTDFPAYTDRTDPLYQSIPFFLGIRKGMAYGFYFNNSYRSRFNLGAGNLRYYSFGAESGPLDYFFIYGPEPAQVVARYSELTGRMPLPPLWALGYQQSRWSYYPESEVMRLAETFRTKRIPADVIYLDIHYMNGYRVFTWDKDRFADPKKMLGKLGQMGFKVVPIIDPGVKVDSAYSMAKEGLKQDHFVRYPDGEVYIGEVWPGPSYFPDFSRSQTREWWAGQCGKLRELGIRGFWNDMNEPAVWGQAFPAEVLFSDEGRISNQKKLHNLYGFLMARATYEGLRKLKPDERPFILTRAGFAGVQRYAAAWTGDNVASDEHLELGIRMMLGMGLSGVPFVGTDIGGFIGTPSPELYARWIQVGALSPFCRTHTHHGSADQEPWSFGENVEDISRKFITLRYRLLPYFYSLFHEASRTGAPLWRPLFWYHPYDDHSYDWDYQHEFFVGPYVLAAPVTRSNQLMKRVYLPAGRWLDINTEELYFGPAAITVDAPLDRLPLFLREGAIIPLRDSVQFTDEKPVQELTLEIFAGLDSASFDLYEDDGKSFRYEKGDYRLTRYTCQRVGEEVRFASRATHHKFRTNGRSLVLRFHALATAPREVIADGKALKTVAWNHDAETRILTVRLAERDSQSLVIR